MKLEIHIGTMFDSRAVVLLRDGKARGLWIQNPVDNGGDFATPAAEVLKGLFTPEEITVRFDSDASRKWWNEIKTRETCERDGDWTWGWLDLQ